MFVIKIKCSKHIFVSCRSSDSMLFGSVVSDKKLRGVALTLEGKVITYQSGTYALFPTRVIARLHMKKIRPVIVKWLSSIGQQAITFHLSTLRESEILN